MYVLSVRKTGQVTYVQEYTAYDQNKSGGELHPAPNLLTLTPVNIEMFTPSNVLLASFLRLERIWAGPLVMHGFAAELSCVLETKVSVMVLMLRWQSLKLTAEVATLL